jgi:hypothetical protein
MFSQYSERNRILGLTFFSRDVFGWPERIYDCPSMTGNPFSPWLISF